MHLSPIAGGLPTHKYGTLRRLKESYGGAIEFALACREFSECLSMSFLTNLTFIPEWTIFVQFVIATAILSITPART